MDIFLKTMGDNCIKTHSCTFTEIELFIEFCNMKNEYLLPFFTYRNFYKDLSIEQFKEGVEKNQLLEASTTLLAIVAFKGPEIPEEQLPNRS